MCSIGPIIRILSVALVATISVAGEGQTFKVLHAFEAGLDGSGPQGALLRDPAGNLYGTTFFGGNNDCAETGCGTIFRLTASGAETIVHRFVQSDGAIPAAGLIVDKAGNAYSTTQLGGPYGCSGEGCGVIYKIDHTAKLTVLYAFTGVSDGANPSAELIRDTAGNLYGTAYAGGTSDLCLANELTIGCGTVFKLDTTGKLHVLHRFTGGNDGASPFAGLITDGAGNLYGTASFGGSYDYGTVFKIDSTGTFSVLHTFSGGFDGIHPDGGLIRDNAGNLYGTTLGGGSVYKAGTIYKLDAAGNETILYTFTGPDGDSPWSSLVMDKNGNLFGATAFGGANNDGAVFELTPSGKETVLHDFLGATDGSAIVAPIIMDSAGNIYGVAYESGPYDNGTAFEILR